MTTRWFVDIVNDRHRKSGRRSGGSTTSPVPSSCTLSGTDVVGFPGWTDEYGNFNDCSGIGWVAPSSSMDNLPNSLANSSDNWCQWTGADIGNGLSAGVSLVVGEKYVLSCSNAVSTLEWEKFEGPGVRGRYFLKNPELLPDNGALASQYIDLT